MIYSNVTVGGPICYTQSPWLIHAFADWYERNRRADSISGSVFQQKADPPQKRIRPLARSTLFVYAVSYIMYIPRVTSTQIKPAVAVSGYTNIYFCTFAHRILVATHKYVSAPHYIHSWTKKSNITYRYRAQCLHIYICLSAWIHWDVGLNHSRNLVSPNLVLFHMKSPTYQDLNHTKNMFDQTSLNNGFTQTLV